MAKVGFVGLGIMGEPMCRNLLAKGHDVTVYNRTPAKMGPLVAAGANAAASLADLVRRSEVTITMVSDPAAVRDATIVGNTVMHHLFCGVAVEPLSHYPFEPKDDGLKTFTAGELGWDLPNAKVP